jgi:murein DD-endopeptidase MepM/ murein hydrolase activator NlpD
MTSHLGISYGNEEFALLAHLRRGSVRARTGQSVKAGTVLGLCGPVQGQFVRDLSG